MRIVVTGSAGFIGGHLVERLLGAKHDVLGIDIEAAPTLGALHTHLRCDIRDTIALRRAFNEFQPTAVAHLAARTDLSGEGLQGYSSNTTGVTSVLEAVRAVGSVQRFICTSSQLVCRVGHIPRDDFDFDPDTSYGISKVETERLCREHDGGGASWCIVRPTTIWGPRMNPAYLPFYRMLRRGTYLHTGSKPLLKSYGYVRNTVHQYHQLLLAPEADVRGKVFYLADYEPVDLHSWAEAFRKELGGPPIRRMPASVARLGAFAGDVANRFGIRNRYSSRRLNNILTEYVFDLDKTRKVCGDLPCTMNDGVRETARWLEQVL